MEKTYDFDHLSDALDEIAAWLLAAYRPRLARISLTLEGAPKSAGLQPFQ